MKYSVKFSVGLDGIPEAADIRSRVFVEEQGFENEFDGIDVRAVHAVLYIDGIAAATARLYEDGGWNIGRVACLPEYRGKGLGAAVIAELEQYAAERGVRKISLSAQLRAKGFYEKLGYTSLDDIHYDEYCPHVTMIKNL